MAEIEFKGTPGPWRVDNEHDFERVEIVGRPDYPCSRFGVKGEWRVAEVDDLMGEKPSVVAANARLIAAAPDLLRALQNIIEEPANQIHRGNSFAARAAIAKALQS